MFLVFLLIVRMLAMVVIVRARVVLVVLMVTTTPTPRSLPYRREVRGDNPGSDGNSDWRDDYRILDDKFH